MSAQSPHVQHVRQVLLWPLRLMPPDGAERAHARPWELLGADAPWREVTSAQDASAAFQERYYTEFVSFLPYVQRFLFGAGQRRIFRRKDIAWVRVTTLPGAEPRVLDVHNLCLHFFFDVDIVLLVMEVGFNDLQFDEAQDLLYRFGRAYPAGWDDAGNALHCMHGVEWLDADGRLLVQSDAQERQAFIDQVVRHQTPRIASHWRYLLEPMEPDGPGARAALRYRQVEYYRMPMMAYLAVERPSELSPADFAALGTMAGTSSAPADAQRTQSDGVDRRYFYDRFWCNGGAAPYTRYICSGYALVVVGDAASQFFCCKERGVLSQFRHQHFLLFMIAHLQKASLLMFSDRLAEALTELQVTDADSVRSFKRRIRYAFESFLRFTHRYWFTEISDQQQIRALFRMSSQHLDIERAYAEVKTRVADMNGYLEADSLRRQANTVVRLTVVTIFGMIGTITTGFLGMNLLAEADAPMSRRVWIFGSVFVITTALTVYTMAKSKRLSDFLDALSDERLSIWTKVKVLASVWRS
ncbi:hypothetical protein ASE26_04890 [Duganella sp. Root198D2]|nr:hypothetical protein ASE26_04890 [Duganella sp. Root198D2]